jgi:pilus assembly protein CpaE
MLATIAPISETQALRAITVSRDIREFDLLIEDMDAEIGEEWGDLTFDEALEFLAQDDFGQIEFVVVALDWQDEPDLPRVEPVIRVAKSAGLAVILVADGLGPTPLHDLLNAGAEEFTPYPLPDGALGEMVARLPRRSRAAIRNGLVLPRRDAKAGGLRGLDGGREP